MIVSIFTEFIVFERDNSYALISYVLKTPLIYSYNKEIVISLNNCGCEVKGIGPIYGNPTISWQLYWLEIIQVIKNVRLRLHATLLCTQTQNSNFKSIRCEFGKCYLSVTLAWKVGDRGLEPHSGLQVSEKQNVSSPLTRKDLIL